MVENVLVPPIAIDIDKPLQGGFGRALALANSHDRASMPVGSNDVAGLTVLTAPLQQQVSAPPMLLEAFAGFQCQ